MFGVAITKGFCRPRLAGGLSQLPWARLFSKYSANDQIYVHGQSPNLFKFSFSPQQDALGIGYSKSDTHVTPETFEVESKFVELLQKTISNDVSDDFAFVVEAGTFANSFMPIYDFREIPRYGRIPEVDNIYGYIQVDSNGKMVPGTYESNNLYRVCNGAGLTKLSDHLLEVVRKEIER